MFKIFSYILKLYRQNMQYERAIDELIIMVRRRKHFLVPRHEDERISWLFSEVEKLLNEVDSSNSKASVIPEGVGAPKKKTNLKK